MITRNLTLTITDKSVSLDKSIILYQYDRGVTFNFKLISADYAFNEDEITKARAIIKRPNKEISVSSIDDILDGTYTFFLDGAYTDDTFEVGIYTMQLQLYSNSDECITIAPFIFEVKELIGVPKDDAAYVGYSTVGYSSTKGSDALDTGDLENGEYLETVWVDKDIITSGRLNKIETVLDYLVEDASNNGGGIDGPITDLEANNSISMGRIGEVGANSIALGTGCQAGNNTSAIGYGLIANAGSLKQGQCVVGRNNEEDTGALFIVGNGRSSNMRSNALVVKASSETIMKHATVDLLTAGTTVLNDHILVPNNSDEGDISHILIDKRGILIKSKERKYDENNDEIFSPEEEYVATKEYVNNAITNIEISGGGNNLPIRVIGSDNPDEPYILTGNEFTDEEWENGETIYVYFKNVKSPDIPNEDGGSKAFLYEGLYECYLWEDGNGLREIGTIDFWGNDVGLFIDSDGTFSIDYEDAMAWEYQLEDYATKEELQTALGDIGSILDDLNGEVIE